LRREAETLELRGCQTSIGKGVGRRRDHALPELFRVVLDPSRLREVLSDLAMPATDDAKFGIDDEAGCSRRTLVDRENHAAVDVTQASGPFLIAVVGSRTPSRGRAGRIAQVARRFTLSGGEAAG